MGRTTKGVRRMGKSITLWAISALLCLAAGGCRDQRIEHRFFDNSLGDRIQRLRQYSLPDQYKIFRYGMDHREPPDMGLAVPIADRGASAVPFLFNRLRESTDDLEVRDILLILETMAARRTYDVASDAMLMNILTNKVERASDMGWRDIDQKTLRRIQDRN
jgi:hypothetical protein